MYECVILYRVNGGPVEFVANLDGSMCVFSDLDAAVAYTERPLFVSGQADHQIVELDEL